MALARSTLHLLPPPRARGQRTRTPRARTPSTTRDEYGGGGSGATTRTAQAAVAAPTAACTRERQRWNGARWNGAGGVLGEQRWAGGVGVRGGT